MVLEVWTFTLLPESNDTTTIKTPSAVYNALCILIKSVITITRATPAYKLSRRQKTDSYKIFYTIYCEKPDVNILGNVTHFNCVKILF